MMSYPNYEQRFPNANVELIPEHCRDGVLQFIEKGLPPGGFLCAVLQGNWGEAMCRADTINQVALGDYHKFLHMDAPASCHGSAENFNTWVELGGLAGHPEPENSNRPKIFAFINSGAGTDWVVTCALAEDGTCLAGHVSSSEAWARHDIGVTSERKHDKYSEHYPEGYEVVWVPDARPGQHTGLDEAYALNQQMAETSEAGSPEAS